MSRNQLLASLPITLTNAFYERIVRDIPAADWVALVRSDRSIKDLIFEGFSTRPEKLARLIRQPQVEVRLRRLLQLDMDFLDLVLEMWGQANLLLVAFVEMLDLGFVVDSWSGLKNLIGPERFLACLALLGHLEDPQIVEKLEGRFWERELDSEALEILLPILAIWRELESEHPRALEGLGEDLLPPAITERAPKSGASERQDAQQLRREQDRRVKVEAKLERAESEKQRVLEELKQSRAEADALKGRLASLESDLQRRLESEVAKERSRWFERYQATDSESLDRLEGVPGVLDEVLKKADRALELQARADEQFGLIGEVGRRLVRIELYLNEIERIYAESLVVHSEVQRAQQTLQDEKKRLLDVPEIGRLFAAQPELATTDHWRRRIRFLEPTPANLRKLSTLKQVIDQLERLEVVPDSRALSSEIEHKERQIQEDFYHRSHPEPPFIDPPQLVSLDDLVQSGHSRKYDVYVDGYNILLQLKGATPSEGPRSVAELREAFITRVVAKGRLFRKIFLVFDGTDGSRDRQGNVDIIFSDKRRGISADAIIIDAIRKRRDKKSLLVTADREIIDATEKRLFGVIEPLHFYSLLFDLDFSWPPLSTQ